ncbi:MAG: 30S ribosomal protein S20 [Candidatus Andersenbacteria bacterium]|nr:30S ribosomal protein S20 [bacterium]MDZ4225501.1 30S ribosomal protein S20 [Candidatus Andersenbacteria bacterium]
MPQVASAKKALRTSTRRRVINDRWRRKLRESLKAVRVAINAKDKKTASATFLKAQSVIDRAIRHKILKPNTAARKKSRIQKTISRIQ